jgi:hypothetical protein
MTSLSFLFYPSNCRPCRGGGSIKVVDFREGHGVSAIEPATEAATRTFPAFSDLWAAHHTFWHAYARKYNIPLLQYRFEDLCQDPNAVMKEVAEFTRTLNDETDLNLSGASGFVAGECVLRNLDAPKARAMFAPADAVAAWERHAALMSGFGYDAPVFVKKIEGEGMW